MTDWTNEQVRKLLVMIRQDALEPADSAVDPRYLMALAVIAGLAAEGLDAVAENRPMYLRLNMPAVP